MAETIPDIITDPSGFDADGEFWLKAAQAAIRRTFASPHAMSRRWMS